MRTQSLSALSLLALVTPIACGEGSPVKKYATPVIPIVESPQAPAEYLLEDPACQDSTDPTQLTSTTIRAWEGNQVVERVVDLHDTASTSSLVTPVINLTSWKDVYARECDLNKGESRRCDDKDGYEKGWLLKDTGDLKICRDGHNYNRLSYEGVALTSAYYLSHAFRRYTQLAGPGAKTPGQVQLSVLPHFIDYNDHYVKDGERAKLKTYITHNLAYFPIGQMIAVFPESAVRQPTLPGYFWESEFVLGHEYGHHIDFTRHDKVLANAGLEWDPIAHGFTDKVALGQGLSAESDRAKIQGAISEAFADLLAYYSEGGTGASLVGLPDIGKNRSIADGTFSNGAAKVLTEDRLSILFGLMDQGEIAQGEPSYRDIHVVGAILSHGADQLFATLTQTKFDPGSTNDVDTRYKLVLWWMDAVVQATAQLTSTQGGADVLQPVAYAFEQAAQRFLTAFPLTDDEGSGKAEIQAELCAQAKTLFPSLKTPPFGATDGSCL